MSARGRSIGGSMAPHQPQRADIEAARALSLAARRYTKDTVTAGDVLELCEMFRQTVMARQDGPR